MHNNSHSGDNFLLGIPTKLNKKFLPMETVLLNLPIVDADATLTTIGNDYNFAVENDSITKCQLYFDNMLKSDVDCAATVLSTNNDIPNCFSDDDENRKSLCQIPDFNEFPKDANNGIDLIKYPSVILTHNSLDSRFIQNLQQKCTLSTLTDFSREVEVKSMANSLDPKITYSFLQSRNPAEILQPVPAAASSKNSNFEEGKNLLCGRVDRKKKFLEDFEANDASPFDSVELKSLNDLEELKSVLQISASTRSSVPVNGITSCTATLPGSNPTLQQHNFNVLTNGYSTTEFVRPLNRHNPLTTLYNGTYPAFADNGEFSLRSYKSTPDLTA